METLKDCEAITILAPHHDDFCLDMLGTMLGLQLLGGLKKLIVIDFFSRGAGISMVPTVVFKPFFPDLEFKVLDFNLVMIMPGGNGEQRKLYSAQAQDLFSEFEKMNGMTVEVLRNRVIECMEGVVLAPMGFKHPDHNFLSNLEVSDYFYREYPYYWNRGESYDRRLYKYNVFALADRFEMDPELTKLKWDTLSMTYRDVMGTFNPRFMRPYFRNVRSEEVYVKVGKSEAYDAKTCVLDDRDFVEERNATHRFL